MPGPARSAALPVLPGVGMKAEAFFTGTAAFFATFFTGFFAAISRSPPGGMGPGKRATSAYPRKSQATHPPERVSRKAEAAKRLDSRRIRRRRRRFYFDRTR